MRFVLSDLLCRAHPGFAVAFSEVTGIVNDKRHEKVDELIQDLPRAVGSNIELLRERAQAMAQFYRQLGADRKYHILSLLSATLKGRTYRSISPAVDLVYVVELRQAVLMGLHDLSEVAGPVVVDLAEGTELINHISGKPMKLERGDIVLVNEGAIMASLTRGPDAATSVTPASTEILLVAFGSPSDSQAHLTEAMNQCRNWFANLFPSSVSELSLLVA